MKKEKLILRDKNGKQSNLIQSITRSLKLKKEYFSAIVNDNTRLEQIQSIEKKMLIDYKSATYQELIHELAVISWGFRFLQEVSLSQEKRLGSSGRLAHDLSAIADEYEAVMKSNRINGALASNRRHDTKWKTIAKTRWQELSKEIGKPIGHIRLESSLRKSHSEYDWNPETIKSWVKKWRIEGSA